MSLRNQFGQPQLEKSLLNHIFKTWDHVGLYIKTKMRMTELHYISEFGSKACFGPIDKKDLAGREMFLVQWNKRVSTWTFVEDLDNLPCNEQGEQTFFPN